jgi:predicted acylesterase/phospholipase RssA
MKALDLSGSGSLGACGAGRLHKLNRNYSIVSGVSTGSLMAPLAELKEWDRLKEAYTTVTGDDIFDYNPFTSLGKISLPKALWSVLTGKPTLGESNNLRKRINQFLTYDVLC